MIQYHRRLSERGETSTGDIIVGQKPVSRLGAVPCVLGVVLDLVAETADDVVELAVDARRRVPQLPCAVNEAIHCPGVELGVAESLGNYGAEKG